MMLKMDNTFTIIIHLYCLNNHFATNSIIYFYYQLKYQSISTACIIQCVDVHFYVQNYMLMFFHLAILSYLFIISSNICPYIHSLLKTEPIIQKYVFSRNTYLIKLSFEKIRKEKEKCLQMTFLLLLSPDICIIVHDAKH